MWFVKANMGWSIRWDENLAPILQLQLIRELALVAHINADDPPAYPLSLDYAMYVHVSPKAPGLVM